MLKIYLLNRTDELLDFCINTNFLNDIEAIKYLQIKRETYTIIQETIC